MSRHRHAAGFTLLEVLVALAMFALLMGMLTSGVRLIMRSYETGTQQTDRLSQLSVVVDVLRDQIANARMSIPGRTEEQGPSFVGALDHLEFVGSLPSQFAVGGLQTIFVGLRQDKAERDLIVRWRPYEEGPIDAIEQPRRGEDDGATVLLDHVRKVEIAYYGAPDPDRAASWQDEWRQPDYPPNLVRLRVVFDDGYAAPDLVAALRVTGGGL
jgi:general secretion pathway protein J